MYTVLGSPGTRAARAIWALEEIGAPYELNPASPHSDAVTAVSQTGKVPALVDGDIALTDSSSILFHLSDKHQALTFPLGSAGRARMMNAFFFAIEALETPVWTYSRHDFILPKEMRRKDEITPALHHDFSRAQETLSRMLGDGPFIAGETFTIADIVLGHIGGWAKAVGFPAPDDRVADYMARVRGRPGWAEVTRLRKNR